MDVNFCPGLVENKLPVGVKATCTDARYDRGARCQLSCKNEGIVKIM